jgi:hypothetical protein
MDAETGRWQAYRRLGVPETLVNIAHFQKFDGVIQRQTFQWSPRFFDNSTERLLESNSRRNDLQMAVLSHHGHLIRYLRWPMPHYYFDIKDGQTLVDPSGLNFKNDDDALAKAKVIAIGVSLDKPAVDPTRHIAVLDGSREEIFRVPVYSKPSMRTT